MSLKIVFRSSAAREFDAAFDWYELRRAGLGVDFVRNVQQRGTTPSEGCLCFRPSDNTDEIREDAAARSFDSKTTSSLRCVIARAKTQAPRANLND